MKHTAKTALSLLALSATMLICANASADALDNTYGFQSADSALSGHGPRHHHPGKLERILHLDAAQKAEIKHILKADKKQRIADIRVMEETHFAVDKLILTNRYDKRIVELMLDKAGKAARDLVSRDTANKAKIFDVLTPEQQEKLRRILHMMHGEELND